MLVQEFFITKRSLEVIVDLFFFSTITIVVFGFVSLFLTGSINGAPAHYLILGLLLWEVIRVNQYSITVGALWNIWSRNLSNMFVSPLNAREYVLALMISATAKSALVFLIVSTLAAAAFGFNILSLGAGNVLLFFVNLNIFSWSIGLLLLGVVFVFGTRIQALAWSMIFLFQPLSASFFPVEVLPSFVKPVAYLIPTTYVFEAARGALENPGINWGSFGISFGLNMIYFLISAVAFRAMFARSKETGQFASNEG